MSGDNMLHRDLLDELFAAEARIGEFIHLQSALVDIEAPSDPIRKFIDEDSSDEAVRASFLRHWPGYATSLDAALGEWKAEREHDRRYADQMLQISIAEILFRSPLPFLVRIEFTIKTYSAADPKGVGLGSFSSGWGYYAHYWALAESIEDAVHQAIKAANDRRAVAWQEAIDAGRIRGKGGAQ